MQEKKKGENTNTIAPHPERANPKGQECKRKGKRRPTETDQDQRGGGRTEEPERTNLPQQNLSRSARSYQIFMNWTHKVWPHQKAKRLHLQEEDKPDTFHVNLLRCSACSPTKKFDCCVSHYWASVELPEEQDIAKWCNAAWLAVSLEGQFAKFSPSGFPQRGPSHHVGATMEVTQEKDGLFKWSVVELNPQSP